MSVIPNKPTITIGDAASVFAEIRILNREGILWSKEEATTLAVKHSMPDVSKVYNWGVKIYDKFLDEKGAYTGTYIKKLEAFLNDTFLFRRNPLSRSVSYKLVGEQGEWMNCNYNDIWRFIQHNKREIGIKEKVGISDVQTILESDYVKEYNPIKDYFDNIEPWDGKSYIDEFASHVQCENQEFWVAQFKKCLVRMIACSYAHIENRIVMTLYT